MPRKEGPSGREEIAERLADAIHRTGDQRGLARKLGLHEASVSRWISRGALDGWVRLRRVCEALNVSADWILGLYSEPDGERWRHYAAPPKPPAAGELEVAEGPQPPMPYEIRGKALRALLDVEFEEHEKQLLPKLRAMLREELERALAADVLEKRKRA